MNCTGSASHGFRARLHELTRTGLTDTLDAGYRLSSRGEVGTAATWAVAWGAVAVALRVGRVLLFGEPVTLSRLAVEHALPALQYGLGYGAVLGAVVFDAFMPVSLVLGAGTAAGTLAAARRAERLGDGGDPGQLGAALHDELSASYLTHKSRSLDTLRQ